MIIWNAKKPGPNMCLLESIETEQNFWATNSIFGWFHNLIEGVSLNKSTAKYSKI